MNVPYCRGRRTHSVSRSSSAAGEARRSTGCRVHWAKFRLATPTAPTIRSRSRCYRIHRRYSAINFVTRQRGISVTILPGRNSIISPASLYLCTPGVLTTYSITWSPTYTSMPYRPPPVMSTETRNALRAYERMLRGMDPPYRLLSLSERMERFRPFTPSPINTAMELAEQRSNMVNQERPRRFVIKREGQTNSAAHRQAAVHLNAMRSNLRELEIIHSDSWEIPPTGFTPPQADEPEIVITADAQIQTDIEPPNETATNDTDVSSTNNPRFRSFYEDVSEQSTEYISDNRSTYSPNIVVDRGTQIPDETYETIEIIDLDPEDPNTIDLDQEDSDTVNVEPESPNELDLDQENSDTMDSEDIINLDVDEVVIDLASSDKSDSEEETGSEMTYKLYARPGSMPSLPASTLESRQVANRVIRFARNHKTLNVKELYCLSCGAYPRAPVTGQCGHTRCIKCIQTNGPCPCGAKPPRSLYVNTVVQSLLAKMMPNTLTRRGDSNSVRCSALSDETVSAASAVRPASAVGALAGRSRSKVRASSSVRLSRSARNYRSARLSGATTKDRTSYVGTSDPHPRMPMAPQIQFNHACGLISRGLLRDATPHLARAAASSAPVAHHARSLLSQVIVVLADRRDSRCIIRGLYTLVKAQAAASWLRVADLECSLCYHTFVMPVTTPCGHTYCRTCIERALDYRKLCALCQRPLLGFIPTRTRETEFVRAALQAMDVYTPPPPSDPDVIPIFVCTVAYPSIPCPLFIFDPRYWLMIRRVLESGSRKFGMVAYERGRRYSDYGTVLQVCDCIQLEDGRSFLSTVGVSRFKVIGRDVTDGCDVARIEPLTDIIPTERMAILDIRLLGSQILCKALMWLNNMNYRVRAEIEAAFGPIPRFNHPHENWFATDDGPPWLWWLIAILPLRSEIKVLILSTKNLLKRMMAVARTLDAIDAVAITTTATAECNIRSAINNADDWLQRGS